MSGLVGCSTMRPMCWLVLQPDVRPGLAGVGGLVDAVAPAHALAVRALTGADPDDVGVRLEDRDVADRVHRLALEHRLPGDAVVARAEDAAGGRRDVHHLTDRTRRRPCRRRVRTWWRGRCCAAAGRRDRWSGAVRPDERERGWWRAGPARARRADDVASSVSSGAAIICGPVSPNVRTSFVGGPTGSLPRRGPRRRHCRRRRTQRQKRNHDDAKAG